ncbi:MAG TPA: Zeta toxin family protein [Desulfobacteraceae bacterium]|nr:Zeta toxin family protein [Desulfobacteraceae bacterium]
MIRTGTENLKIVIIAGPNGAGKTTFAREYLPGEADCVDFINADLIAAGLSPFKPEAAAFRAGRLMLEEIAERVRHRKNFAFETTLSGRTYAREITSWRKIGYRIKLIFLSLPRVEMAVARVAGRVAQGGHSVPEKVIRRRYTAGLRNFEVLYKPLVDDWIHYDNSGVTPRLVEWGEKT